MATATLEDRPVPLSIVSSSSLPTEIEETDSPESVEMLDWQAMLSPSRRSCIKLSNVEPCVNKAVAHLKILKDRLTECTKRQLSTTTGQVHESSVESPKSILVHKDSSSSRLSSGQGQMTQLVVEGVTTGIAVEKQGKPSMKNVSGLCRFS